MASRALCSLRKEWRYVLQPVAAHLGRRSVTSATCWRRTSPSCARVASQHSTASCHSSRKFSDDAQSTKPFNKVLVANRGEIACRVFRTCKDLGIKTVAVYSTEDRNALHVREADESVCIGPAPSKDSYLNIDAVLAAVKSTGANAVHPGYGFLSENKEFAQRLADEGVAFIGPKSYAIHSMGDKIESKRIAKEAAVNVIPGFDGVVKDADEAIQLAKDIGYPVMLKASAGGGGKGMRVAYNDDQVREGFELATAEAKSSFNDHRLLIEMFVEEPRHIEIQVLADTHGNYVYLNERECSIQRRNQKVIEEAPSTFLDEETRKAMGEQAVQLARAVDYCSAGTVEFLVDKKRNFYFLEMNTRLQVEHPITECITGVDLVEQMLRVAAGWPITVSQSDIGIKGWAVECRVYAEDPKRFLPSPGHLRTCREPSVRVDSGVTEGSIISMFYDPMISKVVTHGETRDEAIDSMIAALDGYVIRGVKNNISLLRDVLNHQRFREGRITTNFLSEEYPKGFDGCKLTEAETNEVIVLAAMLEAQRLQQTDAAMMQDYQKLPSQDSDIVQMTEPFSLVVCHDGKQIPVLYAGGDGGLYAVGDQSVSVSTQPVLEMDTLGESDTGEESYYAAEYALAYAGVDPRIKLRINDKDVLLQVVERKGSTWYLQHCGTTYALNVLSPKEAAATAKLPVKSKDKLMTKLLAPLTGKIVSVNVKPGDKVGEDEAIATLEAMKMQDILRSPGDFIVKAVHCKEDQVVQEEDILIEFEVTTSSEPAKSK